jgi:hypothetical protein
MIIRKVTSYKSLVSSLLIHFALMEAVRSSETSGLTRAVFLAR